MLRSRSLQSSSPLRRPCPFHFHTIHRLQGFAPPLKIVTRAVDSVRDDEKSVSLPKDYGHVFRKVLGMARCEGCIAASEPAFPPCTWPFPLPSGRRQRHHFGQRCVPRPRGTLSRAGSQHGECAIA